MKTIDKKNTIKIQYLIIKHISFILLSYYLLKLQVTYYKLIVLRKECHMTHKYEN